MTNNETIVSKLQKLEALRQRASTEAEAAACAARIAEICEKHNLDIGVAQLEREETRASEGEHGTGKVSWQSYYSFLSNACNNLFNVGSYRKKQFFTKNGKAEFQSVVVFYGLKASVTSAIVTFEYLVASVDSILKGYNNRGIRMGRSGNSAFKQGCARRIYDEAKKLKEIKHQMLWGNTENTALVKLENALLKQHKDTLNLRKTQGTRCDPNSWAYRAGYEAGGKVDIHGARTSRMLA